MAPIATSTGALLCILGAVYYALARADGHPSVTALIPLFLGFPIAVLGILARKESMRKHAMHGAVLLALIGLLGSLRGAKTWFAFASGREPSMGLAPTEMLVFFVICLVFIVLCVKSFVAARKNTA